MIKYFSVENFYSIDTKQEIDFCLGIKKESDKEANPVLGIFGANASGKTNLLRALSFMLWFIKDSFLKIPPDMLIPFEQFGNNKNKPTIFKLEITNKDKVFYIELHFNQEVIFESIYYKDKKKSRKKLGYRRSNNLLEFGTEIRKVNHSDLRKNSSIISFLNRFETQNLAREVYEIPYFSNVTYSGFEANLIILDQKILEKIVSDINFKTWLIDHLDITDIGIKDIKVNRIDNNIDPTFMHQITNDNIYLNHINESAGTKKFIALCYYIYQGLEKGSILIIDEIELQLHNNLLAFFVDLFRNTGSNKNGAQLIFSSQNSSVLKELESGQVFFTEKNDLGQTNSYSAHDFKGIKDFDLEKLYRIGRFGAIPRGI